MFDTQVVGMRTQGDHYLCECLWWATHCSGIGVANQITRQYGVMTSQTCHTHCSFVLYYTTWYHTISHKAPSLQYVTVMLLIGTFFSGPTSVYVPVARLVHTWYTVWPCDMYCIVLYCFVLYCISLYCILLYCILLYQFLFYHIVPYHIVSYHIVLYCIVWYCIVLYCIILYLCIWKIYQGCKSCGSNSFENKIFGHTIACMCSRTIISVVRICPLYTSSNIYLPNPNVKWAGLVWITFLPMLHIIWTQPGVYAFCIE